MPFTIERSGNWWTNDDEAGTTDGFDVVSLGKTEGKSATIFTLCFYEQREIEVAEIKSMIERRTYPYLSNIKLSHTLSESLIFKDGDFLHIVLGNQDCFYLFTLPGNPQVSP